jgi:hypothetical protein
MAYGQQGLAGDHHACASCERRDKCRAICRNPFRDAVLLPARNMTKRSPQLAASFIDTLTRETCQGYARHTYPCKGVSEARTPYAGVSTDFARTFSKAFTCSDIVSSVVTAVGSEWRWPRSTAPKHRARSCSLVSLIMCTGGEYRGVRHARHLSAGSSFQIGVFRDRRDPRESEIKAAPTRRMTRLRFEKAAGACH